MSNFPYDAVIATVFSLGGNVLITVRNAAKRMGSVEKDVRIALKKLEDSRKDIKTLQDRTNATASGVRLELDQFRSEFDSFLRRSIADNQPLDVVALRALFEAHRKNVDEQLAQLQTRTRRVENELRQYFESRGDFVSAPEFRHYVKESQEQWTRIIRTLGQIEGMAKRAFQER